MANKQVKNSATGSMGTNAFQRSRFEKAETAFGYIPAAAYANGDTLQFTEIPAKQVIYGRFVSAAGDVLEIFNNTSLASAITWTLAGGSLSAINYVVTYIRGTGAAHPGLAPAGTEAASEYGKLIQLTVSHS